jgi:hypothetical protein
VEFTPFVIDTWCAALSVYGPEEINRAILEVGLSVDAFPSVGKVIDRINANRQKRATHGISVNRKPGSVPEAQLQKIADAFAIKIG